MKLNKSLLILAALSLFLVNCKLGQRTEKSTSVNTNEPIYDASGQVVGLKQQVSATKEKLMYDMNGNGVAEKIEIKENGIVQDVIYDKDQDGRADQLVRYQNGIPSKVYTYLKNGSLRSITSFNADGQTEYVDVVHKNKRVNYKSDKVDSISTMPAN